MDIDDNINSNDPFEYVKAKFDSSSNNKFEANEYTSASDNSNNNNPKNEIIENIKNIIIENIKSHIYCLENNENEINNFLNKLKNEIKKYTIN